MKIWKAELHLTCDINNEWRTSFYFELQDKDYEVNKKFNEWTHFENWVSSKIPMNMVVEPNGYSGLKVVQGFNHCLTEGELKTLEVEMRKALKEHLEFEKEMYLQTHIKKISSI